ncbi:hypothetical protein D5018_19850 [Parashewanella curva]|uniref:Uncharacterized protein n=1 Tax=Parashewanella curva TaxID=2338552 RepID=A0A3L8PTM2_9GAMM|nr:hypothetical protein [Parashewanella curva]RLV57953.1 hypothetical protein D5018_19850 [Parashewanella curva]
MRTNISLRSPVLDSDEMIENWISCNEGYQESFEGLLTRFPHVKTHLLCFAELLTDSIFIHESPLFDICLSQAMSRFILAEACKGAPLAIEKFFDSLVSTTEVSLKNIWIVDQDNEGWSIKQDICFLHWLMENPLRVFALEDGLLRVEKHKSSFIDVSNFDDIRRLIMLPKKAEDQGVIQIGL